MGGEGPASRRGATGPVRPETAAAIRPAAAFAICPTAVPQPQYPNRSTPPPPVAPPAASSTDDLLEQLQKLGELKEAGVLTESEFQAQKAKILAG